MTDTYEGAEAALVDAWIEYRLGLLAESLDDINDGLSERIFSDYAPKNTPYPFIIYQCQDPPRDIRGVGVSRVMVDTLYVVKAVTETDTYETLRPIAQVIDTALTSNVPITIGDGEVLSSVRQNQFRLAEIDAGVQIRNLGGEYQIYAQA